MCSKKRMARCFCMDSKASIKPRLFSQSQNAFHPIRNCLRKDLRSIARLGRMGRYVETVVPPYFPSAKINKVTAQSIVGLNYFIFGDIDAELNLTSFVHSITPSSLQKSLANPLVNLFIIWEYYLMKS